MILPDDELTIQRMLGVTTIPADIHDEYLRRVRFLHREVAGGPMGAGMIVDMLRFLGHEPRESGSTQSPVTDWRQVNRGERVQVRRAGHWTAKDVECRFDGFVDSGTLAVLLPGGYVDEFNKYDVRLLEQDDSGVKQLDTSDTMRDGTVETDAKTKMVIAEPVDEQVDATQLGNDTVSPENPPSNIRLNGEGEIEEIIPPAPSWPIPDWKKMKKGDPVWVREVIDGEEEMLDGKFVKKIPKNVKVLIAVDGEEIERSFPESNVRQPDI